MSSDELDAALRETVGDAPSVLMGRVITAFQGLNLEPTDIDWEQETFDAPAVPGATGPVSGVVMQRSRAVVFHRVYDEYLTSEQQQRVAPAVALANNALDVSAVELNASVGILSLRSAVEIADLDVGRDLLGAMMTVAIRRVSSDWDLVGTDLIAVANGSLSAEAAASRWR